TQALALVHETGYHRRDAEIAALERALEASTEQKTPVHSVYSKGEPMPGRMVADKDGAIGWMIFDHPERRNAVTQGMWLQIGEILEDFGKDEAIRVVVLKGEGDKAFVSGADISQFGQQRRNAAEVAESNRLTDAARKALETFAKPTIAMIQGYCL